MNHTTHLRLLALADPPLTGSHHVLGQTDIISVVLLLFLLLSLGKDLPDPPCVLLSMFICCYSSPLDSALPDLTGPTWGQTRLTASLLPPLLASVCSTGSLSNDLPQNF